MNLLTFGTRQLGRLNLRPLGGAIALAGLSLVVAMLAPSWVEPGQVSRDYTSAAAQAAPSSDESAGYFPHRFAPVTGEIESPIQQF